MFENAIEKINNEISIKKADRQSYADDFNTIRTFVLKRMGEEEPIFKCLYNGPSLFGSYIDNLKIDKPDEFDVHFVLKLPYNDKMIVKSDPSRPGFVNLDITEVMRQTANDPNVIIVHNTLVNLVETLADGRKVLSRGNLQEWIQNILKKVFTQKQWYNNSEIYKLNTNFDYELSYSKCATAHTIKCRSTRSSRTMSIDLVPAFKFTKCEELVLDRPFPIEVKEKLFFAVPKPYLGDPTNRNLTFSVCAPQIEKYLLTDLKNLKPSLRLFKSLRDKGQLRKLKSYFIKSIYLDEYDKQSHRFWENPVGVILIHMIGVLIGYLRGGSIPFYWAPPQNLLKSLEQREIDEIKSYFQTVENKLKNLSSRSYVDYDELRNLFDQPSDVASLEKA